MVPSVHSPLSKGQKRVLYFLSDNATVDAERTKSIAIRKRGIIAGTSMSRRQVVYALRKLERLGYIETVRQLRDDGGHDANRYIIQPLTEQLD